jgi:hypothetical protein
MKITATLLRRHGACAPQVAEFARQFPHGCQPTHENLLFLSSCPYVDESGTTQPGLDPWWLWHLLPDEGIGSKREYAWLCAEDVAESAMDMRSVACRAMVRRMVAGSVDEEERWRVCNDADAAADAADDAADAAAAYTDAADAYTDAAAYTYAAAYAAYAAAAAADATAAYAAADAAAAYAAAAESEIQLAYLSALLLEQP